ncbi:V-type ATP synthase subunit F [Candidatus Woesearchaeota archaeon]|nr:V-type ATP synthase subunit F [Candidatus Woesearchaeota archaeon]
MEIAVIGKEDFCLGFRLAGIKKITETTDAAQAISEMKADESIGIVILDENLYQELDADSRAAIEDSIKPIFIALSQKATEDSLKKMIRKSIGVEL